MNEFEQQLKWSEDMADRNLVPFYREHSRNGQVVTIRGNAPMAKIIQRNLHADALLNRKSTGDMLSIEEKMRRPQFDDFLVEVNSCTVPGHETLGWWQTTEADIVLYCRVHQDEKGALCFPIPMAKARPWFDARQNRFHEQMVENRINGRALWSRNLVVPRRDMMREVGFEGFNLRNGELVADFWARSRMDWLA